MQPQQEGGQQQQQQEGSAPPAEPSQCNGGATGGAQVAMEEEGDVDNERMLQCDGKGCGLWVHAACEGVAPHEYDEANATPNHPLIR